MACARTRKPAASTAIGSDSQYPTLRVAHANAQSAASGANVMPISTMLRPVLGWR
jgi:hypothetical protein